MHKPVRIDFIAMDGTPELRGAIERQLARLLERQGPARSGHVAVKGPGAHRRAGRYEVSIRLAPAEGPEIVVGPPPKDDARNADIAFAIDDAFRRARRRLQDQARRLREGAGKRKTPPEPEASAAPSGGVTGALAERGAKAAGKPAKGVRAPAARKTAPAAPLAAAAPDAAAPSPAMRVDNAPPQAAPLVGEAAEQTLPNPASLEPSLIEPAAAESPPEPVREATAVEPARASPPGIAAAVAEPPPVEPSGAEPALIEPTPRLPESADAKAAAVPAATKPAPSPVADDGPTLADLDTLSRSFAAAAVAKSIERLEPSISASISNIAPLSFAMALTFMKTAAAFNAASTTWMNSYFACLGSMMQPPPAAEGAKDAEN